MANNATVTLTFKVQEDGTLKAITGNINKATKATDNLASSQDRAAKASTRSSQAMNGGVASANNSARGMSRLLETIGGDNTGLVGAYATLATNAFAVSAAFNILRNAAQSAQVMQGLEVQGARLGITLTNTAKSIQEISRGSLSMADSMQAAAQASAAGFSTQNITDLTKAAQNASIALGRNMPDALDRMIKGTTKLEPELLDELGVMVKLTEANNKYAIANDKSATALTGLEKRQAFLNAVLEESNAKFGGLSDEVAANPYDKLAATFDNLIKSVVGFVDSSLGLRTVVGFLADNTGALVAILVLFASTISRQLIPSLYQASEAAARSTAIINKKIEAQKRQIAVTLQQAKAERDAASASTLSKVNVTGSPKRVKDYVQALKEGNTVEGQREKALRSINGALGGNEAALKKITDQESAAAVTKKKLIADLRIQKAALETLTTAEINHASLITNSQQKLDGLRKQSVGYRLQGIAATSRANAIELAGEFELKKAYSETARSFVAYKRGLENVADGNKAASASSNIFARGLAYTSAAAVPARAALFGLSMGVRILGAAFLNLIPIIGQVLMVWELLKEAYSYIKDIFFPDPAGTKELEKAADTYKEILDSTKEAAVVSSRIFSNASRTSLDITQGFGTLSNKVNEIADSFAELEKRKAALGTDAAKQIAEPTKAIAIVSGKSTKDEAKDAVEGLSSLRTLGYGPLIKEIDKAITNNEEFWAATGVEQARIASKTLKDLKERYGELGETTKSLDENYKKISNSYDAFISAATIKTPFDELVKNWDEQSVLIVKLQKDLETGVIKAEDFGKKLSQIKNDSTISFIDDTAVQNQLNYIRKLETYFAKQKELLESGKSENPILQLRIVDQLPRQIASEEAKLANIMKEAQLRAAEEVIDKQKIVALAQAELKLIQAKLQANASILSSGEEGLRYRLKLEQQSRDLQIKVLQTQKTMIDMSIAHAAAQSKMRQDELDHDKQKLLNSAKLTSESAKRAAIEAGVDSELLQKGAKQLEQRGAGNAGNKAQVIAQRAYLDSLKATEEAELEIKKRVGERAVAEKGVEIESRQKRLASLSLEKDIQAIAEQGLSTAKTEALISQARLNRISKEREERFALLEQEDALLEIGRKRAVLLSGNAETFSEEIRSIKEAANSDRKRIANSYEVQRLKLLGDIQVAEQDVNEASAEAAKAANETLAGAKLRLEVLDSSTAATLRQKDAEEDLAIQTKIYVDTRKLGLELQEQSLQFLKRESELSAELARTRLNTAQINKEISLKNMGLYKSEEQQQAFEIQTATQAYEIAVKEAELKKSLIDLEFALLDGQKEVLKQQLIERKASMIEAGYGEDNTAVKQISAAIDNIAKAPSASELASKAKQQLDATIEQLASTLKNVITIGGSSENSVTKMLATISGIQERGAAREAAKRALEDQKNATSITKAVTESGEKAITPKITGIARSNELLQKIVENTNVNAEASRKNMPVSVINGTSTDIRGSDTAAAMAKKVADSISQDPRLRVSEISGYGNIGGHKKGSMHYNNRAFDLNVQGVGNEASDPAAKALLDQKAIEISRTGMQVLWNGMIYEMGKVVGKITGDGPHTDHLHAEVDTGAYNRMKALYANMNSAALEGASRASQEVLPANDNAKSDIVVSASPKAVMSADTFAPSGVDYSADLPPVKEFTQYSDTNWDGIRDKISQVSAVVDSYAEKLKALGPEGEVVAAIAQGSVKFGDAWTTAFEKMDTVGATTADKVGAVASAISASIGVIQSVTAASSNAKVAAIDKEIAAEQKRDGKSAGSVAKLESLEKKKDSIARKQFNTTKKLMMAQAVMSTAAAVAGQLAATPVGPWNIALATMMGAFGLAQVAMIAGTQYESTAATKTMATPSALSIGKRSDTVDLARGPNANAGGEAGYLRGSAGTGTNASNYRTTGSAYGGELMRGYGNRGFVVGEKGPEVITPETPISVTPADSVGTSQPVNATFNIHAIDSQGVQDVLVAQKGNIIKMLRDTANASGKSFMEDVNVNVYTRPSVGKL